MLALKSTEILKARKLLSRDRGSNFLPRGQFFGQTSIDPWPDGAFRNALEVQGDDVVFTAVDDNSHTPKVREFEEITSRQP